MTLAVVLLATVLFFAGLQRSGLVERCAGLMRETGQAVVRMRDKSLDDDAREALAQRIAMRMFGQFGLIVALTAAVAAVPLAVLGLATHLGVTDAEEIWRVCLSWPFIAINIALFAAVLAWTRKANRGAEA